MPSLPPAGPMGHLYLLGPAWSTWSSRAPRTEGHPGMCWSREPGLQVCVVRGLGGQKHGGIGSGVGKISYRVGGDGSEEVKGKRLEKNVLRVSGESQAKDCPSTSSGRAWVSRKGSPRAPGEFLALPLLTCPRPPSTSISQLPAPIHLPSYRALLALRCSRAQL